MIYLLLSFMIGTLIVVNMILNAGISQRIGMLNGLLVHYLGAAATSVLLCFAMQSSVPAFSTIRNIPLIYFIGGVIGVVTTYLFNIIIPNVNAFYVVLLRFIGQLSASAMIDYFYLHLFSMGKIAGALLFLLGLFINANVDRRLEQENKHTHE